VWHAERHLRRGAAPLGRERTVEALADESHRRERRPPGVDRHTQEVEHAGELAHRGIGARPSGACEPVVGQHEAGGNGSGHDEHAKAPGQRPRGESARYQCGNRRRALQRGPIPDPQATRAAGRDDAVRQASRWRKAIRPHQRHHPLRHAQQKSRDRGGDHPESPGRRKADARAHDEVRGAEHEQCRRHA
jgi:hypothetical protein